MSVPKYLADGTYVSNKNQPHPSMQPRSMAHCNVENFDNTEHFNSPKCNKPSYLSKDGKQCECPNNLRAAPGGCSCPFNTVRNANAINKKISTGDITPDNFQKYCTCDKCGLILSDDGKCISNKISKKQVDNFDNVEYFTSC